MEHLARVYSQALFEVAKDKDKLDLVHDQLDQLADVLKEKNELSILLFSPFFSSRDKKDGLAKVISGADPVLNNFLNVLIDKHRMPVIQRIRRQLDELWEVEHRLLPVRVTSAVGLDKQVLDEIGKRIERQTGRRVKLVSNIDENILGGLVVRVGNQILDASVRNRLERLRKQVAQAV